MPEMDQDAFAEQVIGHMVQYQSLFIVDDDNKQYSSGRGPVVAIFVSSDGEIIKPVWHVFKWATNRNKLRTFVTFLQMVRYSKDVALCVIFDELKSKLMMRARRYGLLLWEVGNGTYCITGRKKNRRA